MRAEASLEDRMQDPEPKKQSLLRALGGIDFGRPKREYERLPYYKYELVDRIIGYLQRNSSVGKNFGTNLESTLNKEELKRVYYGMFALKNQEIPAEILEALEDWEKVCFFAGIWMKRSYDPTQPVNVLVREFVKAGYDGLHKKHMIKKAEGVYKRSLKIPGSQAHRKEQDDVINRLCSLFKQEEEEKDEERKYEIAERVGIMLDSCSDAELLKLTQCYGRERLGAYARPSRAQDDAWK